MLLLPGACSRCCGCFALLSSSLRGAVLVGWGLLGCRGQSRLLDVGEHEDLVPSLTQGLLSLLCSSSVCLEARSSFIPFFFFALVRVRF